MKLFEKIGEVSEGRQINGINSEMLQRGQEVSLLKDFEKVIRSIWSALVLQMIYFAELFYDPRVVSLKTLGR